MLSMKTFVFIGNNTCKKKTKHAGWPRGVCILSTIHQQTVLQTHAVPITNAWIIFLRQTLRISRLGKKFRAHYKLPSSSQPGSALITIRIKPAHIRTHHDKSVLKEDGIFCINSRGRLRSAPLNCCLTLSRRNVYKLYKDSVPTAQ
jgi:hypothetical protein